MPIELVEGGDMSVLEILRARTTFAFAIAALAVGCAVITTASSATATTSCPSTERVSQAWAQESPILAPGDMGCAVAQWQARLNDWLNAADAVGAAGAQPVRRLGIDGVFGARTGALTRHFQASHNLSVDGVVGPMTRWAYLTAPEFVAAGMGPSGSEPLLETGSTGLAVTRWQSALDRWFSRHGGETGRIAVDGVFGPETDGATRAFQASQDLVVDGLVGPMTRGALADELALDGSGGTGERALAPAEATTPAAGICGRADGAHATITLEPDVPRPRCVAVSPTQRLRVENGPLPATVELAGSTVDLAPDEGATIGPEFGTYLAPGVHTVHVSIYGGSGPELWLTG
jgi:peptidoglycan hydrolase-like protein with peptidoglycan-binding domain